MSTQFKNSNLSYYLYSSIVIIIGAASVFVFWYMFNGYKAGSYSENTLLGSVYLEGYDESDVAGKMTSRIDDWLLDDTIVFEITYQGYSYEFDRELLDFNIETSIDDITNGITNDLYVSYNDTNKNFVINEIRTSIFLNGIETEFDLDAILERVIYDASYMKSFSSSELEDYLIDKETSFVVIHQNIVETPALFDVNNLMIKINNNFDDGVVTVNSNELFSVLEIFDGQFTEDEMTMIAIGMLDNIKYTNFVIHESHYNTELGGPVTGELYDLTNYPYFGKQTRVVPSLDDDFSFYNPNDGFYEFTFSIVSANEIMVTMSGLAFVDTIIVTETITIINYITQETDDIEALRDGKFGKIVEVNRRIINSYGDEIIDGIIIFEFYKPETEIILDIE
ncbi:MAG: hypothetical protein QM489_01905 [Candidatus Izemoplasma sp.]